MGVPRLHSCTQEQWQRHLRLGPQAVWIPAFSDLGWRDIQLSGCKRFRTAGAGSNHRLSRTLSVLATLGLEVSLLPYSMTTSGPCIFYFICWVPLHHTWGCSLALLHCPYAEPATIKHCVIILCGPSNQTKTKTLVEYSHN